MQLKAEQDKHAIIINPNILASWLLNSGWSGPEQTFF